MVLYLTNSLSSTCPEIVKLPFLWWYLMSITTFCALRDQSHSTLYIFMSFKPPPPPCNHESIWKNQPYQYQSVTCYYHRIFMNPPPPGRAYNVVCGWSLINWFSISLSLNLTNNNSDSTVLCALILFWLNMKDCSSWETYFPNISFQIQVLRDELACFTT